MIYLDNAATTKPHPAAVDEVARVYAEAWGNPSSRHPAGERALHALHKARLVVSKALGCSPRELVFTAGGTEADNLAVLGAALSLRAKQTRRVIVSAMEHQAVLRCSDVLKREGFEVVVLPVDEHCLVKPSDLRKALRKPAALVSVMLVNNEVGSIQPIRELAAIAREAGALFHTDAVQAFGKIPLAVRELNVDLLTVSAHKIHGPKGVGALYVRHGVHLRPIMVGGGQEGGLRSGTENVPAIAGFAKAVELLDLNASTGIAALRDELEKRILSSCPGTRVNAVRAPRACHLSNISFPMVPNGYLLNRLAQEGVCATSGSACNSHTLEPSHVLQAMGQSDHDAQSVLRFSLSAATTHDEIVSVSEVVAAIIHEVSAHA